MALRSNAASMPVTLSSTSVLILNAIKIPTCVMNADPVKGIMDMILNLNNLYLQSHKSVIQYIDLKNLLRLCITKFVVKNRTMDL